MHDTPFKVIIKQESVMFNESFEEFESENFVNKMEIDFDSIPSEKEYIGQSSSDKVAQVFVGDSEESKEIDSIVNLLNPDDNSTMFSASPFKLCSNIEENTQCDEILSILKRQPQTCKNDPYLRGLSRSNPGVYNKKKISMNGRILQNGTLESFSPVKPICVPKRVSNPFLRNFDLNKNEDQNTNYSNKNIKISESEHELLY